MKVTVDDLPAAVQAELDSYGAEVEEKTRKAIKSVANTTKKRLVATSPKRPGSGRYAKGWKVSVNKKTESPGAIIYNKDRYFLTHLLENPHKSRSGRTVSPKKHIEPAVDQAARLLPTKLAQELNH